MIRGKAKDPEPVPGADARPCMRKEMNDHFFRNYYVGDEDKAGNDRAEGGEEDATDDE